MCLVGVREAIFKLAGRQVTVQPIPTTDYPTKAARPLNSRMSKECLSGNGFEKLPEWKDALARYLKEITG